MVLASSGEMHSGVTLVSFQIYLSLYANKTFTKFSDSMGRTNEETKRESISSELQHTLRKSGLSDILRTATVTHSKSIGPTEVMVFGQTTLNGTMIHIVTLFLSTHMSKA